MGTFANVEEAREYFIGERFAMANGMVIDELDSNSCTCSMEIQDYHRNALGGVMGGAIFTLADFAFAVSANNDHRPTVAMNVDIHYLSGSQGSRLYARSARVKDGRSSSIWQVTVTDDLGRDIALFTGTGFKL